MAHSSTVAFFRQFAQHWGFELVTSSPRHPKANGKAESAVKFPRHYDGKFFAYDWMRGWINPVTMSKEGDFVQMERFMPNTTFDHMIDMQFAKDGSLYTLEYGQNWFAQK